MTRISEKIDKPLCSMDGGQIVRGPEYDAHSSTRFSGRLNPSPWLHWFIFRAFPLSTIPHSNIELTLERCSTFNPLTRVNRLHFEFSVGVTCSLPCGIITNTLGFQGLCFFLMLDDPDGYLRGILHKSDPGGNVACKITVHFSTLSESHASTASILTHNPP